MKKLRFGILLLISTFLLISAKFYPAFGMGDQHTGQGSLNGAMYTFHSGKQVGELLPEGTCLVCHPGPQSAGTRHTLASIGVDCDDCHIGITAMENPEHIRGLVMLSCMSCHAQGGDQTSLSNIERSTLETQAVEQLAKGHAQNVTYLTCETCHTTHLQESFWHFGSEE